MLFRSALHVVNSPASIPP